MSWVRYDDGFYSHPKVLAVIADDPGAISLHILANTWSSGQKRPGWVPRSIVGILVGDKRKGAKWATLLERHGLWDSAGEDGWEFHDHADYRESSSRSTPGTPAEVSAKRRAAGSKGGKATQQRKQTAKQTEQQTEAKPQATAAANKQLAVSPVVNASSEALTPEPVPEQNPPGGAAAPTAQKLLAEHIDACRRRPPSSVLGQLGKHIAKLLEEDFTPDQIRGGLELYRAKDLSPGVLPSLVNGVANGARSIISRTRAGNGVYDDADEAAWR